MSSKKKATTSAGLFAKLQEINTHIYSSLPDINKLKDFLLNVPKEAPTQKEVIPREFVIQMGSRGMEAINELLKKDDEVKVSVAMVDYLNSNGYIEQHQHDMLVEGLRSGNDENYKFSKKLLDELVARCEKSGKIDK